MYDNQTHPTVKGKVKDVHKMCGMGVDYILKNSLLRRSLDNVTVVIIGFNNFKHTVFGKGEPSKGPGREERDGSVEEPRDTGHHEKKKSLVNNHSSIEQNKVIERTKSANLPKYKSGQDKFMHGS